MVKILPRWVLSSVLGADRSLFVLSVVVHRLKKLLLYT